MQMTLITIVACAGLTTNALAQTTADAGLAPHELVAAGFTPATTQLVVDRLDDQDVVAAWNAVSALRVSAASAQTTNLDAQFAHMRAPGDESLLQAKEAALSSLESIQASLALATAAFEALAFDQIPAPVAAQYNEVRDRRHKDIEPELLALDWDAEQMSKLISALQEERRAIRRGDDLSNEAYTLLLSARSQTSVITARSNLQTMLAGVKSVVDSAPE